MTKSKPTDLLLHRQSHIYEDHEYDFSLSDDEVPSVRIQMTEVHEDRGAIWCRFSVYFIVDGQAGSTPIYGPARINLMRADRGGMLGIQEQLEDQHSYLNWEPMISAAKIRTIAALEEQLPVVPLGLADRSKPEAPFLSYPYIARSGVTVLYGDGGTGKSTLALALGIEVSTGIRLVSKRAPMVTGPVIYADYEDDDSQHANRVQAIADAHNVPLGDIEIFHTPLLRKVAQEGKRLRRLVSDHDAVLVILDSIGMGRGGDALAAEDTIRMFRALRSLEVPVLAIDHISKAAKATSRGNPDPYGSVYTRNSARMMWLVERRQAPLADPWDYLVFTHTKANHVRRIPAQYLKVKYVNALQETSDGDVELIHSLRFEPTDVTGVPAADAAPSEATGKINLVDEMVGFLWVEGAKNVREMADHFGKSEDTIRKTANRGVDDGKLKKDTIDGLTVYMVEIDDDDSIF